MMRMESSKGSGASIRASRPASPPDSLRILEDEEEEEAG